MMSNSEARKRLAANEPSADVEELSDAAFDAIHKALCDERLIHPDADSDALVDWLAAHASAARADGARVVLDAVENVDSYPVQTTARIMLTAAREAARNVGAS